MNLKELKQAVDQTIEVAKEQGRDPSEIVVSLQINSSDGPRWSACWTSTGIGIHEDGGGMASGAVIVGEDGEADS